jgi:hypothetical protein
MRWRDMAGEQTWATSRPIHWLGSTPSIWVSDSTEVTERSPMDVVVDVWGFPLSAPFFSSSVCPHLKVLVTIITSTMGYATTNAEQHYRPT